MMLAFILVGSTIFSTLTTESLTLSNLTYLEGAITKFKRAKSKPHNESNTEKIATSIITELKNRKVTDPQILPILNKTISNTQKMEQIESIKSFTVEV